MEPSQTALGGFDTSLNEVDSPVPYESIRLSPIPRLSATAQLRRRARGATKLVAGEIGFIGNYSGMQRLRPRELSRAAATFVGSPMLEMCQHAGIGLLMRPDRDTRSSGVGVPI